VIRNSDLIEAVSVGGVQDTIPDELTQEQKSSSFIFKSLLFLLLVEKTPCFLEIKIVLCTTVKHFYLLISRS